MGLLSLVALIPALRGEVGTSLCMLAADYLLDSQKSKDRENPQMRTITEIDYFPILRWALGTEWVASLYSVMRQEQHDIVKIKNVIIERWNEKRGYSLYLYDYEPFQHNFMRISQQWVNAGCPN